MQLFPGDGHRLASLQILHTARDLFIPSRLYGSVALFETVEQGVSQCGALVHRGGQVRVSEDRRPLDSWHYFTPVSFRQVPQITCRPRRKRKTGSPQPQHTAGEKPHPSTLLRQAFSQRTREMVHSASFAYKRRLRINRLWVLDLGEPFPDRREQSDHCVGMVLPGCNLCVEYGELVLRRTNECL